MVIGVCHQILLCNYFFRKHCSSLHTHWRKRRVFMFVVPVFLGRVRKRWLLLRVCGRGNGRQEYGSFPIVMAFHGSFLHVLSIQTQWQKSLVRTNIFSGVAVISIITLIVACSENNGRKLCRSNQNSVYTSLASDTKWSSCFCWRILCLLLQFQLYKLAVPILKSNITFAFLQSIFSNKFLFTTL